MRSKEITTIIFLVILVTAVILLINYIKANGNSTDEKTMQCIAQNSELIVSKTCGHCAAQKDILGKYLDLFTLYEASESPEILQKYSITAVPSWIINGKTYTGVRTTEQLKELTGC